MEAEMDLSLAKSQGYLRQENASSSEKKLLAVIGVYTGFGSRLKRNVFRGSWMPTGWLWFVSMHIFHHNVRRAAALLCCLKLGNLVAIRIFRGWKAFAHHLGDLDDFVVSSCSYVP